MPTCLVTGGTGLIGAHLLPRLAAQWEVIATTRRTPAPGEAAYPVTWVSADLAASWSITALPEKIDAVIHLAQSPNFRRFPEEARDVFHVNTLSTLHLLDYARRAGARTFILASTGGVYGFGDQPFAEHAVIPAMAELDFYARTKLCAEIVAQSFAQVMNVIVLRFFFVYGPGQPMDRLIPRIVQMVIDGKPIVLQGQDGMAINPTYVSDGVAAVCAALALGESQTINVGGAERLTLRQIGESIGAIVHKPPSFEVRTKERSRHLVGDIQRMTAQLGAPQVPFARGIEAYIRATYGAHFL